MSGGLDRARVRAGALAAAARDAGPDPVLVVTRGKVGSSALRAALRDAGRRELQVHYWSRQGLDEARRHRTRPRVEANVTVARALVRARPRHRWDVLTATRDLIAQRVSWFFEIGELNGWFDPAVPAGEVDLDALTARFATFYWNARRDWFADELRAATGFDAYALGGEHGGARTGLVEHADRRFRVVLVRYEDLDRVGPEAVARLAGRAGTPDAVLPRANVGERKAYAALYRRFRDEARVDPTVLDDAYASAEMQAFYTDHERSRFRAAWEAGRGSGR